MIWKKYLGLKLIGATTIIAVLSRHQAERYAVVDVVQPSLRTITSRSVYQEVDYVTSRAYAAMNAKSPLVPFQFARREPGDKDVSIAIEFCGICHTDLHQVATNGRRDVPDGAGA